jgi:hypothetical protein
LPARPCGIFNRRYMVHSRRPANELSRLRTDTPATGGRGVAGRFSSISGSVDRWRQREEGRGLPLNALPWMDINGKGVGGQGVHEGEVGELVWFGFGLGGVPISRHQGLMQAGASHRHLHSACNCAKASAPKKTAQKQVPVRYRRTDFVFQRDTRQTDRSWPRYPAPIERWH